MRDVANRAELERLGHKLDDAWERMHTEYPEFGDREVQGDVWRAAGLTEEEARSIENLRAQLAKYDRLYDDGKGSGGVPQLVALDFGHEGATRAAVSLGDLDSATNVGVYTPGIGSRIGKGTDFGKSMTAMDNLRDRSIEVLREAGEFTSGKTEVATVYWLDYSAPAGLEGTVSVVPAVFRNRAVEGGTNLAGFGEGIEAVNAGARVTTIGHSYGSVVALNATTKSDAFDTMAVVGSPGQWIPDVLDSHVGTDNRYFATAKGDPVAPFRVHSPFLAPGEMGYERLPTDAVDGYSKSTGHSQYLEDGSASQQSLAALIAGHPEEIPGR